MEAATYAVRWWEDVAWERPRFVPRASWRSSGIQRRDAVRHLDCSVVEGVLLPDRRAIPERRTRPRHRETSLPIWLPRSTLLPMALFPHGTIVSGPFRATGRGFWRDGEGFVDWTLDEPVSERGVLVRVTIGNRFSGAYELDELEVVELPAGFTP